MKPALPETAPLQLDDNPTPDAGKQVVFARKGLPGAGLAVLLLVLLIAAAWAIWSLASGVEFLAFEQRLHNGDTGKLKTPVLAQSFQSTAANLSRIELQLTGAIPASLPDDVELKLVEGDGLNGAAVYQEPLSAARVVSDGGESFLSFAFPALPDSRNRTYTVALVTPGYSVNSFVQTGYAPVDALSSGKLYTEDGPQPGDLAITAYYRYSLPALVMDTIGTAAGQLPAIAVWLLFLLLPGLTLLLWLPNSLTTGQRVLAAPGMTALSLPLFYLYANLVGLAMSALTLWVILGLCLCAVVLRLFMIRSSTAHEHTAQYKSGREDWVFWAAFGAVMVLTIITRLLSLRGMQAGMGLDAYHHTLITEMFLRDGGIPGGYAPYGPLQSFTYHFGFHGLTAAIAWLTGNTTPTAVMTLMPQVGQVAGSVLPIPALALYGWRVLGNRWTGLSAGALAGLVSVVPAFYVEWSRYTQGLGLALLPVAWVMFLEATGYGRLATNSRTGNAPHATRSGQIAAIVLAVIGAAGLFLSHYRIMVIYAGFAGLYLAWRVVDAIRTGGPAGVRARMSPLVPNLLSAVITGVLTLLLLVTWLLNLGSNFVKNFIDRDGLDLDVYFATAERLGANVLNHPSLPVLAALCVVGLSIFGWKETRSPRLGAATGAAAGLLGLAAALYLFFNPSTVTMERNLQTLFLGLSPVTWLLLLEIIAFVFLVWLAKGKGALLVLPAPVWLILALWSSPQLLPFRLPYVGYLDAVTLASVAWLPVVLIAGYALVSVSTWVWDRLRSENKARGTRQMPLARAVRWLAAATALLVVLASGLLLAPVNDRKPYIAQADVEAMLWMHENLPANSYVLANSFTFPWSPTQALGLDAGLWIPLVAGLRTSVPPITAYNERPNDPHFFEQVRALIPVSLAGDRQADWQTLKDAGITHIYIGSRAGDAGFSAQQLLQNSHVTLIYHKDAVWLFHVL